MGVDRIPLVDRARGRWRGILPALGVDARFLTGKHTPCPVCRGGKDRFRFDDKDGKGTWICSQCDDPKAGDGVRLVMAVHGWEFKEAARRIEEVMGDAPIEAPKSGRSDDEKRQALNRMWKGTSPIRVDDPAALFLRQRVGLTAFPPDLRHAPRIKYVDDPPSWHPAMVAMVRGPGGEPVNLHRTYLTKDGEKAPVGEPRRMMEGRVPPGAAIQLFPVAEELGVAEGIETAFAASALFGVPVWACINSSILAQWRAPPEVRRVIVFGDHDLKLGGQAAAFALGHKLSTGRAAIEAEVRIPERAGADWNDVLLGAGDNYAG